jgi:hypothetical protein
MMRSATLTRQFSYHFAGVTIMADKAHESAALFECGSSSADSPITYVLAQRNYLTQNIFATEPVILGQRNFSGGLNRVIVVAVIDHKALNP